MEVSPGNARVIGDFGNNVWANVGDTSIAIVKLPVQVADAACKCIWKGYRGSAHKLVWVFESNAHRPMFVGVIGHSELGRAAVMYSHIDVGIFIYRDGEIRRHRG